MYFNFQQDPSNNNNQYYFYQPAFPQLDFNNYYLLQTTNPGYNNYSVIPPYFHNSQSIFVPSAELFSPLKEEWYGINPSIYSSPSPYYTQNFTTYVNQKIPTTITRYTKKTTPSLKNNYLKQHQQPHQHNNKNKKINNHFQKKKNKHYQHHKKNNITNHPYSTKTATSSTKNNTTLSTTKNNHKQFFNSKINSSRPSQLNSSKHDNNIQFQHIQHHQQQKEKEECFNILSSGFTTKKRKYVNNNNNNNHNKHNSEYVNNRYRTYGKRSRRKKKKDWRCKTVAVCSIESPEYPLKLLPNGHTLSITGRRFNSTYGSDSKLCLYDPKLNILDSIIVQDQLEDVDSMKNLYASAGNELHLLRLENNDTEQPRFTEICRMKYPNASSSFVNMNKKETQKVRTFEEIAENQNGSNFHSSKINKNYSMFPPKQMFCSPPVTTFNFNPTNQINFSSTPSNLANNHIPARICFMSTDEDSISSPLLATTKLNKFEIDILQLSDNSSGTEFISLQRLKGHENRSIRSIRNMNQRNCICSVGGDIRIWDIRSSGECCTQIIEARRGLYDLCHALDNYILVAECSSHQAHVFDLRMGNVDPIFSIFHFGLTDCCLTSNYFVTSSLENPTARIYDVKTGREISEISGWGSLSVNVSSDGKHLLLSESKYELPRPQTYRQIKKQKINSHEEGENFEADDESRCGENEDSDENQDIKDELSSSNSATNFQISSSSSSSSCSSHDGNNFKDIDNEEHDNDFDNLCLPQRLSRIRKLLI